MRMAILDDEQIYREELYHILSQHFPRSVIDVYGSAEELLQNELSYDVLLLDIELPKMNGMRFASAYRARFPYIIYVTTHDECIYDCFDSNIYGFVVKTALKKQLIPCIEKVLYQQKDMISLHTQLGIKTVESNRIAYFYIDQSIVYAHLPSGDVQLYDRSLKQVKEALPQNKFCFVNRNYLVNVLHITRFYRGKLEIEIDYKLRIVVSRRIWKELLHIYQNEVRI